MQPQRTQRTQSKERGLVCFFGQRTRKKRLMPLCGNEDLRLQFGFQSYKEVSNNLTFGGPVLKNSFLKEGDSSTAKDRRDTKVPPRPTPEGVGLRQEAVQDPPGFLIGVFFHFESFFRRCESFGRSRRNYRLLSYPYDRCSSICWRILCDKLWNLCFHSIFYRRCNS